MIVISYGTLRNFFDKHADSKDALNNWYRITLKADWSNYHEIKAMFNSVDAVGNEHTKSMIKLIVLRFNE